MENFFGFFVLLKKCVKNSIAKKFSVKILILKYISVKTAV